MNWRIFALSIIDRFRRFYESTDKRLREIGVEEGMTFLDVGCGLGLYSFSASSLVGKTGLVYALDINQEYLKWIGNKAGDMNRSNIKTIEADASNIGLPNDSIDIVFLHLVLHDIKDRTRAIKEFHRVLRSGGRLAVDEEDIMGIEDIRSLTESEGFEFFKRLRGTLQIFKKK